MLVDNRPGARRDSVHGGVSVAFGPKPAALVSAPGYGLSGGVSLRLGFRVRHACLLLLGLIL